jgi:hypothetical protein
LALRLLKMVARRFLQSGARRELEVSASLGRRWLIPLIILAA